MTVIAFAPGLRPVVKHGDPSRPGYAQQHPNSRGGGTRDVSGLLQEAKEQGGRMEIGWPVPPELRDRFDGVVEEDDATGREALGKALIEQAKGYALLQGLRGDDVKLFAEAMYVRAESHARQRQAWEKATPEERRGVKEVLDDVRRNGRVCIAADLDSAYEILTTERFASQFETGTSGGLLNPRVRARSETAVQDLHPDVNDEHRPIYGYVASDSTHIGDAGVSQYGSIRFVLHDDVKDRATMTVGDSLNTYAIPVPMTGDISTRQAFEAVDRHPWASSPPPTDPREVRAFQQTNYFEAQIHEGVRIDDIDYIEIADRGGTSYYSDVEQAAADAGIDLFYRD